MLFSEYILLSLEDDVMIDNVMSWDEFLVIVLLRSRVIMYVRYLLKSLDF